MKEQNRCAKCGMPLGLKDRPYYAEHGKLCMTHVMELVRSLKKSKALAAKS